MSDAPNAVSRDASAASADALGAAAPPDRPDRAPGRSDRIELAAAVLLAFATIVAAWSAYQSTRWSGVQTDAYNLAAVRRTDAAQATSIFAAESLIDVEVWLSWLQHNAAGNEDAATFLEERFRDEFAPAFEAWIGQVPEGEVPPGTPFEMDEYQSVNEEEVLRLNDEADAFAEDARRANQIADNFVLTAVIMAAVLFFAGVGTRFEGRRVRQVMLGFAVVLLVAGLAFTLSMPQSVAV